MSDYTPGPWRVLNRTDILALEETSNSIVVASTQFFAGEPTEQQIADARLIAAAPSMAETLVWIRENLHPKALGRGATDAELLAIGLATKVLREAGVIPTPVLEPAD